jgi:transcriptional regulator with XRE-family HTH domain
MGYRGKLEAQEEARLLRAENMTLADIAATLGVSKSSVSVWVRDVPFTRRNAVPAHSAARILPTRRICARSRS